MESACPAPPFANDIKDLEETTNHQNEDEVKTKLANLKKLSDEVGELELAYKKEYEAVKFAAEQSAAYQGALATIVGKKLTAAEKDRIAAIVKCAPNADELKKSWIAARNLIPHEQSKLATAQDALSDATEDFKEAKDYKTNQKDLDDIRTQSDKEFAAQNYRPAYFLVSIEMKNGLKTPDEPAAFNTNLEAKAKAYSDATEGVRKAKLALDNATADAQKKKKDFEEAKSKRRAIILKQIADEPFTQAAAAGLGEGESSGGRVAAGAES
jgi:hypothetical protein